VRWTIEVDGTDDRVRFLRSVGCHGRLGEVIPECLTVLADQAPNADVDSVPAAIVPAVRDALRRAGIPGQDSISPLPGVVVGDRQVEIPGHQGFSRPGLLAVGAQTGDQYLRTLAASDVCWDAIVEVTPIGEMPTFDATVAGTHNFVANGVIAHNSLEQDADVVLFLYRDEMYNPESADRGTAEVIVAKHRNGPTGKCQLAFLDHHTRFANMARV
jgi:replicative DNA helicase